MQVLIADDESIIRMGLKSMLEQMGHVVISARDGREALQMAERYRLDLAILDIKMPHTDGLQVAKTLAQKRPLPILILTAFSQQALIDRATDLPIHGYLVKPIRPEELGAAIAVATKRFADSQALAARTAELEGDLQARKLIDRAKARLIRGGLTEDAAYRAIQDLARRERQSMSAAAATILAQDDPGSESHPGTG